ncbi:MAG TPA: cytochrome c [Hyphomicrobiaceae bacterium]|nr:cytochrome c [Hyphomicrobiaceae bacterium]
MSGIRKHPFELVILAAMGALLPAAAAWAAGDPQRGEPLYQRYCSGCHGVDGRGGGKNFMPHVGALAKKGHTELLQDSYLAAIIAEGGEPFGKSAFMPAWKSKLSEADIADIIAYIRTFPLY